jgi:hypothetical protein
MRPDVVGVFGGVLVAQVGVAPGLGVGLVLPIDQDIGVLHLVAPGAEVPPQNLLARVIVGAGQPGLLQLQGGQPPPAVQYVLLEVGPLVVAVGLGVARLFVYVPGQSLRHLAGVARLPHDGQGRVQGLRPGGELGLIQGLGPRLQQLGLGLILGGLGPLPELGGGEFPEFHHPLAGEPSPDAGRAGHERRRASSRCSWAAASCS